MNWDAIGAIGQMLGSVAVFVTLGYLAIQQRYTRRELQRSISQSRSDAARQLMMTQATDGRLSSIINRADREHGAVYPPLATPTSTITLEEGATWASWEFAWWQYRTQTITHIDELPAGERTQFDRGVGSAYGLPGRSRAWYEHFKVSTLNPDAVRYIDNLLAQPR